MAAMEICNREMGDIRRPSAAQGGQWQHYFPCMSGSIYASGCLQRPRRPPKSRSRSDVVGIPVRYHHPPAHEVLDAPHHHTLSHNFEFWVFTAAADTALISNFDGDLILNFG